MTDFPITDKRGTGTRQTRSIVHSDRRDQFQAAPTVEWEDPDENDGQWPYPTRYVRRTIDGPLADAIRRRLKVDADVPVEITEAEISGGWSEYTQETDYEMTISCGGVDKEFFGYDNLNALLRWLDEETP